MSAPLGSPDSPHDGAGGGTPDEDTGSAASGEDTPGGLDRATALGVVVVLLAVAGICALLADHLLIGALRLAAGVLAGLAIGAAVLALPIRRRRTARILAASAAAAGALALTVPAVLDTRLDALADHALADVEAIGEGDQVISVPRASSPVLVRSADGTGQLLQAGRIDPVDADDGDLLALSAEGTHLLHVTGETTTVHTLVQGSAPEMLATFDGSPVAMADDVLVMRACEDGTCRTSGYELAAATGTAAEPPTAIWTVQDAPDADGPDPAGIDMPARQAQPRDELGALRDSGVLPQVALRHDPAQGWVQVDPATGFAIGEVLAGADQDCRIIPTSAPVEPASMQEEGPVVLTVCSADDGAMTARAHRDGLPLWESDPSPAGEWTLRADRGRVIAQGTEAGTDTPGEIVVGEQRAAWTAPGGGGLDQATALTARIGIDGTRMLVTNTAGQIAAYGTLDGTDRWSLPMASAEGSVRGTIGADSAVVLDEHVRTRPLDAREAHRLRVIDLSTGEVTQEIVVDEDVDALMPVGAGSVLVTVGDRTYLLGR